MYVSHVSWAALEGYVYFVDTLGNICAEYDCPMAVGAGVRPHVTMSANQIEYVYAIETKTDGNGIVKSAKYQAQNGEVVSFSIVPNKGYVLKEVKVTDLFGNTLIFTDNEFTMPSSDVTIEATFIKEEKNPETRDAIIVVIVATLISASILLYWKKNNLIKS